MRIRILIALGLFAIPVNSAYSQAAPNQAPGAEKVLGINSRADDYGSAITTDGLTMYFASNRFGKTHIYFTKRKAKAAPWSDPEYCNITPNPQDFVGGIALDEIGRFYFATNREANSNNIWEGYGLDSSKPTIRVMPDPVNTTKWESMPSVTREGKDLYFASNRESPAGSVEMLTDIFVSHRNSDESWTNPQNLGPQLNIGIYNTSPYISPDGRFLFFASKEKKGVDIKRKIYMSEHTGPSDTAWSKPILLPAPINSDKDDLFPVIADEGRTIYFSSNRDGKTGMDIYEAELPENIHSLIYKSFMKKN